jgi:hypothetical protein
MFKLEQTTRNFSIKKNFANSLTEWGKKISSLTPFLQQGKIVGSLSYRHALGFVITCRGANLADLKESDLLYVESCDLETQRIVLRGEGELPEETLVHGIVYENRSGAIFAFFIRAQTVLAKPADVHSGSIDKITNSFDDVGFLQELKSKLGAANVFFLADTNILSFGCTSEDAGEVLLKLKSE